MAEWPTLFIRSFFERAKEAGIDAILLRQSVPDSDRWSMKDLDILISLEHAGRMRQLLAEYRAFVVNGDDAFERGGVCQLRVECEDGWLPVDVHVGGLALGRLRYLDVFFLRHEAVESFPARRLKPESALVADLMQAVVVKGGVTEKAHARIAKALACSDFDHDEVARILNEIACSDRTRSYLLDLSKAQAGALKSGRRRAMLDLIWTNRTSFGRVLRALAFYPFGFKLNRLRGRWIYLAGIDGSGKSTLNAKLVEWASLASVPLTTTYGGLFKRNLIPAMKRSVAAGDSADAQANTSDADKKRRHPVVDFIRKVARDTVIAFDLLLRWFRDVRPALRAGKTVIMDRSVIDILRLRGGLPIVRRLIVALYPKPEMVIFLRPKPEEAVARKPDLTLEEASELDAFYGQNLRLLGALVVEVSEASADATLDAVVDAIGQNRLGSTPQS